MTYVYAYCDGDNVGDSIKTLFTKRKVNEAIALSENIKIALFKIEQLLQYEEEAEIIIIGGDDILIKFNQYESCEKKLAEIVATFNKYTGLSMSCGIGEDIDQSIYNLGLAKRKGKNRIEKFSTGLINMNTTQPITLYIFTKSEIPDVYINSMVFCLEKFNITNVVFLDITKDIGQKYKKDKIIEVLMTRIKTQLNLLQESKYTFYDRRLDEWKVKDIMIERTQRKRYENTADLKIDYEVLMYESLSDRITFFINNNNRIYVDFSAMLKGYMLDIYTILKLKNINDIYVFEIKKQGRKYDETELIHNLSLDNSDYEYVCLVNTKHIKDTVTLTSEQAFNNAINIRKFDKLRDMYTNDFANIYLFIYLLFVVILFIACILIVYRGGWDKLEPWTFLCIPFLGYVIELIFTIILKKQFTIKPEILFNWLKKYKRNQLEKKLNINK